MKAFKIFLLRLGLVLSVLGFVKDKCYCQSTNVGVENNLNSLNNENPNLQVLDSLFLESNFEKLAVVLSKMTLTEDTAASNYLSYLVYITDTIIEITKREINTSSFVVSMENIRILDDLNFYLINSNLNWLSLDKEISSLKCQYNSALQKKFTSEIDKAYKLYKSGLNVGLAGQLVSECQFYRLKFFRNSCFDKPTYDILVKKLTEVSNWIEKTSLDAKYQAIADNRPEWVKKGMSFEEYQEWWAQRLTVGSEYLGGGCISCGKTLYRGKRGGVYYINSKGNKQYIPRK
jgi:hypothetical protein